MKRSAADLPSRTALRRRRRRRRAVAVLLLVLVGCVLLRRCAGGRQGAAGDAEGAAGVSRTLEQSLARARSRERPARARKRGGCAKIPTAIEDLARRELGLIKPGEKLFIIKDVAPPEPQALSGLGTFTPLASFAIAVIACYIEVFGTLDQVRTVWTDSHVAGWSSPVARWAHNPKVGGSNPAPATNTICSERSPVSATSSHFGQHPASPPDFLSARFEVLARRSASPCQRAKAARPGSASGRWRR